jgi:hypothetical protein
MSTQLPATFHAKGIGYVLSWTLGPLLALGGAVFTVIYLIAGRGQDTLGALVLMLIGAASMSTLRQYVIVDDTGIEVRGRLRSRRVPWEALTACGRDRMDVPWVAAEGQRPFRIFFVRGADFVIAVYARVPHSIQGSDSTYLRAPKGTDPFFTF